MLVKYKQLHEYFDLKLNKTGFSRTLNTYLLFIEVWGEENEIWIT